MTSANHDMPPRQPDENEPVDHPAPDFLDYIDETVTRITNADVDEHLRKVLDQSGYRSRQIEAPPLNRPAGDPPAANAPRGRSFSRFLIALSGAVPEIVDMVPGERVKFQSQGSAILITAVMAVVSMWFALASAMGVNGILAVPVALLWGLVILGIDRWLVTSMPPGSTRRKLAIAAPRIVLALLLGTLISTPLVLRVFQHEINAEIPVMRQQQIEVFNNDPQNKQLAGKVDYWTNSVSNLRDVINSRGLVPVNPDNDPVVQSLTAQRAHEIKLEQQYYQQWQCQLYGGQGCTAKGNGALAQASHSSYIQAAAQVARLNNQIQERETELTSTSGESSQARYQQAVNALPAAQAQLKTAQARLFSLQASFTQAASSDGLLARLDALDRLASKDPALNSVRFLLFLLFLVIECLPVTVKLLQQPGDYEKILARMIIDERLKFASIWEEREERQHQQSPAARQEEHRPSSTPQDTRPGQASSDALTVPDHLRKAIDSIYPFMKDTEETAPPAYREELENCFLAIAEAVNDLRRDGYDNDQIAEALRFIAATATRHLTAGWQAALAKELRS